MGLVGDDESEVRGRKQLLVLVVEEQGLHGTDNDPGLPPIVAFLFVDDCPEVVAEQVIEYLMGLLLQFQAVYQEERAMGVAGTEKELDDGRRGERFTGAGGHLEKKAVIPLPDRPLQGVDGFQLIRTQKA